MPNLMWLIVLPLFFSLFFFACSSFFEKIGGKIAFVLSLIPLILLIFYRSHWIGSSYSYPWMPSLGIAFDLQMDALSLFFVVIVCLMIPFAIIASSFQKMELPEFFYGLVFLLEAILIAFFTVRDLAFFTFFWEAMLIPLYFIIALWGDKERSKAAMKFLLYMIAGSALMVAAVLTLYFSSSSSSAERTFNIEQLSHVVSSAGHMKWIFAIFLLAFAVKAPLFPFHGWLPEVYSQASTAGTILLAAILSKAGIYGILRIGIGIFPGYMHEYGSELMLLAITGVLYGGFSAWSQNEYKKLLAYSSFSHVNFILAALFISSQTSHTGAILQSLNHALTITALFLVASWLFERIQTKNILKYGGLAAYMPKLAWLTVFFVLSSVALPGTNSFVGEFLILLGVFNENVWMAALLALTVILSAIYMLRWLQLQFFGTPSSENFLWVDLKKKELVIALPLILIILWIGIYPAPLLNLAQTAASLYK